MTRRRPKLPRSPFDSPRELRKRHVDATVAARQAFDALAELLGEVIRADLNDNNGPSTVYLASARRARERLAGYLGDIDAYLDAATVEAQRLDGLVAAARARRAASQ